MSMNQFTEIDIKELEVLKAKCESSQEREYFEMGCFMESGNAGSFIDKRVSDIREFFATAEHKIAGFLKKNPILKSKASSNIVKLCMVAYERYLNTLREAVQKVAKEDVNNIILPFIDSTESYARKDCMKDLDAVIKKLKSLQKTTTVCLSESSFKGLEKQAQKFQKELKAISTKSEHPDMQRVVACLSKKSSALAFDITTRIIKAVQTEPRSEAIAKKRYAETGL